MLNIEDVPRMMDAEHARPREQWWMTLRDITRALNRPPEGEAGARR